MSSRRQHGDVYSVSDNGLEIGLIQHIGDDCTLPGSNVIVALDEAPADWMDMANDAFALIRRRFAAHVFLPAGETLRAWQKVGHKGYSAAPDLAWCSVNVDDLRKPISRNWQVWRTGTPKRPPKHLEELIECEFGFVMAPDQIVERIQRGAYSLPIPERAV